MTLPRYTPDETPVLALPPGKTLGAITGVQVGPDGHIWVLHIKSILEWGPPESRDAATRLPAVCEFDADGNYLQGWGGPDHLPRINGQQQWPRQEETIHLDDEGTLWVFGADTGHDHAVQRFTRDGRLLLRIGRFGETGGEDSPDLLGCPTDAWHDVERREVFVTDGYVNHRVAVFDSDTGALKRAFGAYGKQPVAGAPREAGFANPVHAVSLGPDGCLYISDRKYDRVQVFDAVGKEQPHFVREIALDVESPFGAAFNVVFTPDKRQMLISDGSNFRLWVVDLATWSIVGNIQLSGADLSSTLHKITCDADGNLLIARTAAGMQRLRYEGTPA